MKQLALGRPFSRRSWQERETGTRKSWCFHHSSWSTELVRQQLERLRSSLWREPRTSFPPPPSPCPKSLQALREPWQTKKNWWFVGVTFGLVALAQKAIDYISILSQHHLINKTFTFKLCTLAWNGIIQNVQRIRLNIIICTIPEPETRVIWSNPTRTRPEVKKPYSSRPGH